MLDTSARGGFFAVDSRVWAWVCQQEMNLAVAYLVLARDTGPDNRTTTWSTNAVGTYTSISRHRARDARLIAFGTLRTYAKTRRFIYLTDFFRGSAATLAPIGLRCTHPVAGSLELS